jgi:hypothetical protein
MAEADPAADNTTAEGKEQNRRVAVNILVSKAVEGIELQGAEHAGVGFASTTGPRFGKRAEVRTISIARLGQAHVT